MAGSGSAARCRRRLAALALSCWAAATTSGAPQEARPSGRLSFDSSVTLVLVDVRVSRGRETIVGLTPGEVTLLVDGTPRPIVSFIYAPVVVPPARTPAAPAPAPAVGAPGLSAAARRVLFLVDSRSLDGNQARQLQRSAEAFVARLPREVEAGVATLPLGATIRFDERRSATLAALRAAFAGAARRGAGLEGIAGYGCTGEAASAGCGTQGVHPAIRAPEARAMNAAAEWLLRGRQALGDLRGVFRALDGGPASDVVIVSGALPYEPGLRPEIQQTFDLVRAAGVRVHAVEIADLRPAPLAEGGSEIPPEPTFRSLRDSDAAGYGLPEETGGVHALGTVSGAEFFTRLGEELSSTYLVSFEPTDADRDGRPHRIEVRVSRPDVTVRARRSFVARAPSPDRSRRSTPSSDAGGSASAAAMAPATVLAIEAPKSAAWAALARAHEPGAHDRAIVELGQWDREDLSKAVAGLGEWRRRASPAAVNDVLFRGALLHSDLVLLAPELAYRFDGFSGWDTQHAIQAVDGLTLGPTVVSAHWRLARELLDRLAPDITDRERVLRWYQAVGATLIATRGYAAALHHLEHALRRYPDDRDINMQAGLLREILAANIPEVSAGVARTPDPTRRKELQTARHYLARAVAADPRYDAARLHLARVCHLLGDDEAAARALADISRTADSDTRYLAEMLDGSIHQSAGRFEAARQSYERAAALQPRAQSPLVALSHLAREAGRRRESVAYVERLAALPPAAGARADPWWRYEEAAVANHFVLLDAVRAAFRSKGRP